MKTYISLVFIVLSVNVIFFSSVNSLECRYCSSTDYSSDCRTGNETNLRTCTIDGEDHCYVEYILNDGRKPLYRRGCAPGDWCQQQVRNHGTALKFCNTCQGSKCNDDTIGSKDPSTILCRSCESENYDDECRHGTVQTTESCQKGSRCLQYYVSTSRRDIWRRECGDMNSCAELEDTYGHSLEECNACKHELCNNKPMRFG